MARVKWLAFSRREALAPCAAYLDEKARCGGVCSRKGPISGGFTRGAGHQLAPAVAEIPRPAQIGVVHPPWIIVWCVETAVVRYNALPIGLAFAGDLAGKAGQY